MQTIVSVSPDNAHQAVLENVFEIRFGPAYYHLKLDGISFGERIFGSSNLWSPDSQYFAVQEWDAASKELGSKTRLILIDHIMRRECVLSWAEQGFIVPKKFEGNKLIYTKKYYGKGIVSEYEIEFLSLDRWKDLT